MPHYTTRKIVLNSYWTLVRGLEEHVILSAVLCGCHELNHKGWERLRMRI
jgi:hypothetical protein